MADLAKSSNKGGNPSMDNYVSSTGPTKSTTRGGKVFAGGQGMGLRGAIHWQPGQPADKFTPPGEAVMDDGTGGDSLDDFSPFGENSLQEGTEYK